MITSAASGLGRTVAGLFLEAGAAVVITDINGEGAVAVADEFSDKGPVIGISMDVSDEHAVRAGFVAASHQFVGIDVLINNAAYRGKAAMLDMSVVEWDAMHEVCTRGSFLCLR